MEDFDSDYFWGNESFEDARTLTIDQTSTGASRASEISELFPEFVSKLQDERARRAAAEEEEKRERLRKLLGLDKAKARDSAETIGTPEDTLSSSPRSSSESSGNLCLRDIAVSDSQLKLLNIYNMYPVPEDPGLVSGFWVLFPREVSYKEDGIQKFMDVSGRMKLRPIKKVCEMLKTDEIDLGFYGIDPRIVRALSDAITNNTSVQTLNLQENWLTVDACFHLNDLLINNGVLSWVNLSGCRMGPRGAKRLMSGIGRAPVLEYLNVSKCELGDEGGGYICDGVCDSISLKTLDLSDNSLEGACVWPFYYMLAQTETLEEINLSWNSLKSGDFWKTFLLGILKNFTMMRVDLSWNSLGKEYLPFLMQLVEKSKNITELNLSNNRFDDEDVKKLSTSLSKSETLQKLFLKNNPIGPEGALALIKSLTPAAAASSRLRHLDLDNIWANTEVIPFLQEIRTTRSSLTVKLGGILSNYQLVGPDPRRIFLKRANFEAMKPKKKKQRRNFGHFVLSLEDSTISKLEFRQLIRRYKLKLTESLIAEIMSAFQVGKDEIDQAGLKAFYLGEYPETTPPPPKPEKKRKEKKRKGDKDGKAVEDNEVEKQKAKKKKVTRFE
ncbi:RAN GTPase-activating protein 1-like [Diachasma alloeum]|uniref:RAN GTPase-activating protein 1-like n=1 Tax=Diachasma alloeum TaxID=454923 RepID=UPI0007381236|nr:RAN GTPase-activating protein 1-like [Diachasma alloeum]